MLCRFWHQKNSPLYISITSKCKFFPRNLSETVMKTSFSILLFYGGTRGIGQDFGEEKIALSLIFCSFQGLFTYKWQWRTKSSSTVVQGSIKRKPSSNIAGFPRDLNEDNGNRMSIVAIFVLVFTSSLYWCYEQYNYTWPGLRAGTDQSRELAGDFIRFIHFANTTKADFKVFLKV